MAIGVWIAGRRSSAILSPLLRREFFPEVDAGASKSTCAAPRGTRIEVTEERSRRSRSSSATSLHDDLELIISEIGVTSDWSAAYTPNAGPMDAVVKVQLHRAPPAFGPGICRHAAARLSPSTDAFSDLEFAFDAGGMIRGAMNEGKSTPINIRIQAKNLERAHKVAEHMQPRCRGSTASSTAASCSGSTIRNTSSTSIGPRRPTWDSTRRDVMKNVIAALQFEHPVQQTEFLDRSGQRTTNISWACSIPEGDIKSIETLLDIPITSPVQNRPIPLQNIVSLRRDQRAGRGDAHEPAAHDRPDDGRFRPRPGTRGRRRGQGRSPISANRSSGALGSLTIPTSERKQTIDGSKIDSQRRIRPHAGHIPQPAASG